MEYGLVSAAYISASVLFILSLGGLSNQEKAKRAVWFGIAGMGLSVFFTVFGGSSGNFWLLFPMILIGSAIGYYVAQKVEMTEMPQLVAALHSFVGLAAVFIGINAQLELSFVQDFNGSLDELSGFTKKIASKNSAEKLLSVLALLSSLDRLLSILKQTQNNLNFIIYCDDLSFSYENDDFKILKVLLDGGLIEKPRNVIFYCTSNRKHLIPRNMSENVSSSISPNQEVEEKVSLSDRFGLILGFYPFSQDQFIEMIINYKNNYKIPISDDETIKEAIEWQQTRGARSGRVAWQFILYLAGKYEVNL